MNIFKKSAQDSYKVVKRGNLVMLAVGLLLGSAFGAVITSLANDIIFSAIAGQIGFESLSSWVITVGKGSIKIGSFLSTLIAFIIIAFFIFTMFLFWYLTVNYIEQKNIKSPEAILAEVKPKVEELILHELKELNKKHTKN